MTGIQRLDDRLGLERSGQRGGDLIRHAGVVHSDLLHHRVGGEGGGELGVLRGSRLLVVAQIQGLEVPVDHGPAPTGASRPWI